jgi:hypothetical protein
MRGGNIEGTYLGDIKINSEKKIGNFTPCSDRRF